MTATESAVVTVEPSQSDFPGQALFTISVFYLDQNKQEQKVVLTALEPLLAINAVNDALRNPGIDLRRITADALPAPAAKEEVGAGAS
jgi:hypothetical protein